MSPEPGPPSALHMCVSAKSGGGVWRSTDFTAPVPTWTPLLDHFPSSFPLSRIRGLSNIGAVAVDPNHLWVIFAGSGDPDDFGPNVYGQGMLKSADGGQTWQLLDVLPESFTPGFCRILVDPADVSGNTMYAAGGFGPGSAFRGIFKSSDAGARWVNMQSGTRLAGPSPACAAQAADSCCRQVSVA